jgi:diphthine synthase
MKVLTINTSTNFNNIKAFKIQEQFYGRSLIVADRDLIEQGANEILQDASLKDVALLVVGDPFGATTHTDLVLRARQANISCKIIHNASIMNAVGCCGLQVS